MHLHFYVQLGNRDWWDDAKAKEKSQRNPFQSQAAIIILSIEIKNTSPIILSTKAISIRDNSSLISCEML